MTASDPLGPAATIAALSSTTHPLGDLTALPAVSGLYAWWAAPEMLPHLPGPAHPHHGDLRLLYIGIASNLRRRIISNHMRRSGSSTLRRTLAGLLITEHGYRTKRTDRVVLIAQDEARLTDWMHIHLQLTWCEHHNPAAVEPTVIARWAPPLNLNHAAGAIRNVVAVARTAFHSSA
ncbi:GIY-YIG nuclease family protein [Dietzia sp. SLG510A3-3B2-2]|nr:GIY-YIG nuclease family protein [Dietzia sp. SLG510A3-40A3]MBB1010642.1 GIY-YIG nuclease family protein [Dietzia sp. SLG510A3-3B2-2]